MARKKTTINGNPTPKRTRSSPDDRADNDLDMLDDAFDGEIDTDLFDDDSEGEAETGSSPASAKHARKEEEGAVRKLF